MTTSTPERRLYATFEKHGEFLELQNALLQSDLRSEQDPEKEDESAHRTLQKLSLILHECQEQSYLLDRHLESLVTPVVDQLKCCAKLYPGNGRPSRALANKISRIADLLYYYFNFRGYKTIVRYFPHEISDLTVALNCMLNLSDEHSGWPLRYVMLIWLHLICMIPFDLSQFDEHDHIGTTANQLEDLAKAHLGKAGVERDSASLLLSRLYMRKDTCSRFSSHLLWTLDLVTNGQDVISSIGALQVICQVVQDGPVDVVSNSLSNLLSIVAAIDNNINLQSNAYIRKLKYKLLARVGVRLLPARTQKLTRGKLLVPTSETELHGEDEREWEVAPEVENILQQLFDGLQDRDTIVRWSASKGVARVAERLPATFSEQVLETVMNLFSVHFIAAATLYDLPAVAERAWHGACLACAEMARRGLVPSNTLPDLLGWMSKALYFDLRKGAHSIGSNVRDAAAYVLWSLARTQGPSAIAPHAESLAQHLVVVSLFDREVHVRRAASAAFQEFVGRTSLFPAGIDILRKIDFYAVSVKRSAFLDAASQVAEHGEYRPAIIDHLLNVSLRHWDESMRELASQSLHRIILTDFELLFRVSVNKTGRLLESVDPHDLHGALLALTEIASASDIYNLKCDQRNLFKDEIFASLSRVQDKMLFGHSYDIVAAGALQLIAKSLTPTQIMVASDSQAPRWKKIIEFGLRHRNPNVQEAAAEAMGKVSQLQDSTLTQELASSHPAIQQSLGRFLGTLRYDVNPVCIEDVLDTLLECVTLVRRFDIEARRTCYQAMSKVVATVAPCLKERIPGFRVQSMFRAMLAGLKDYSNDARGDVGSWIRITSQDLMDYLPPDLYRAAIAGILKQGLERLDNVRQVAGECFITLLKLPLPTCSQAERWRLPGNDLFQDQLLCEAEPGDWGDGNWFFPKAMRFLEIADFRSDVLAGIVMSMGSKTDSIHRPMASNLVAYIETLPAVAEQSTAFDALTFVECLTRLGKENFSNNHIIVPVFQTFNALLESDTMGNLPQHSTGLRSLEGMFDIVVRNVPRIKSLARVQESMKIVINLLVVEALFKQCVSLLKLFFLHDVPRIRMDAAEYFYLKLQSADTLVNNHSDEVEAIILETEWMSNDRQAIEDAFECILRILMKAC